MCGEQGSIRFIGGSYIKIVNNGLNIVGLAKRANALVSGFDGVAAAIRAGRVRLVLVSADGSDSTKKRIIDKCVFYKIENETLDLTSVELGEAIGLEKCACIAFCDDNFVKSYRKSKSNSGGSV